MTKKRTIVPFGPQHPVLPEPIHLDLVLEDEKVVDVLLSIGFVHRGLEKLVEKRDFVDFVFIAERICGICSFIHGMGYCQAVEEILKVDVPDRAHFLRTIWAELSRIHSHLLWLGLLADSFGFESLFMHTWRVREKILDIFEMTTGGRVIFSACKVGGVRKDMDIDMLRKIGTMLKESEAEIKKITDVFIYDASVKKRLVGIGVLTKQQAFDFGAVGPTARASGIDRDMRSLGYAAYPHASFEPILRTDGDSYGRCVVRIKEIFQSIDIINQLIPKVPEGPLDVKIVGASTGEFFARLEQPRGEVVYYVKANGSRFLERFRVRTPTFANVTPLIHMLKGCELSDVPVIVLTIDPCISCTER